MGGKSTGFGVMLTLRNPSSHLNRTVVRLKHHFWNLLISSSPQTRRDMKTVLHVTR